MRKIVVLCLGCLPLVLNAQSNLKPTVTQRYLTGVRKNLETSADAMPNAKYRFKLTDGQMSFAEWINHSTERNYADCATLKGPAPEVAGSSQLLPICFSRPDTETHLQFAVFTKRSPEAVPENPVRGHSVV